MFTPRPATTTGRRALLIISAACLTCRTFPCRCGRYPGRFTSFGYSNSPSLVCASLVMSISTAPGRPVDAMWNASFTAWAISPTSVTR